MTAYLVAGVLAGLVGLLVFLVVHHFWIMPIWFIALPGAVIAALGGLAVGWSYGEIRSALSHRFVTPSTLWQVLGVLLLTALTLAPAVLLSQLRSPLVELSNGAMAITDSKRATLHFILELVITAPLVGSLAGWWLTHSPRGSFATALAGLVFALGPGHNIPFLPWNTPAAVKGLLLLAIISVASAIMLVGCSAWLTRQ